MTDQSVVIVGVGGMAREAAAWWHDYALRGGGPPLRGFVDDDLALADRMIDGLRVLGPLAELETSDGTLALIAVGSPSARAAIDQRLTAMDVQLATLVHPTAVVGPGVILGAGTIVGPQAVLTRDIAVGRSAIVNFGAALGHDSTVGEYAFVGPGAHVAGDVTIGPRAQVGIGASVIQGVTVGAGAVVGAGAAVIRDVPAGVTTVGVPAEPRDRP